jgi:uncharacterized membrane protein
MADRSDSAATSVASNVSEVITQPSRARLAAFVALSLSTAFCLTMLAVRPHVVGVVGHLYLVWNLFLAWIPFVVALVIADRAKRGKQGLGQVALIGAWLVFLPNAPYIVTDLIHLPEYGRDPLWFDATMYLAFAWTGMLLGLISLYLVHRTVRAAKGPVWGWGLVTGAVALCGVGIYLGRFMRWNSWDVLTDPTGLLVDLSRFTDLTGKPTAVAAIFAGFIGVAYLGMYSLAQLRDD